MSIEKDVERMFREDAEMQKKYQKKKKNSRMATIILLILIAIVALLLAELLGLFDGLGRKEHKGGVDKTLISAADDRSESSSRSASSAENESSDTAVYENIKVSGSTFLYKGSEITIDEIKDIFSVSKMNMNVIALIEDDNATQNTMDELTGVFRDMGRKYKIEAVPDIESAAESLVR
ncbi:hypothetical protein [uncultured Ruminococcus sp.]|uniref:hypothetical protein n=1 Tax=uncultured Ruminococcus sp. TaxID=165186 RepID=UPI0025DF5606|nr:hypothetical protein [uncultured Ruminococcus sp.]